MVPARIVTKRFCNTGVTMYLNNMYLYQVLAHHCSWFSDVFDRMNKDSAEVKWRQLSECDSPETAPLPDVLDQRSAF